MSTSLIMTFFREYEEKYERAGSVLPDEDASDTLLAQCSDIERRMKAIASSCVQDLAAKIVVETRYGDFCISDPGEGGVYDEALALLANYQHPDAKLIELGQQFEAAKNEARKFKAVWKRTHAIFKKACQEAGLTDDAAGYYASRSIARRTGHSKAYSAFSKAHGEAIKIMKAIHRAKASTLEGYTVKVAAIAFDQSDFEVSDPVPSDVAERELYRLARDMAKTVKAKSVLPAPSLLNSLIEDHRKAEEAYEKAIEEDEGFDGPEWVAKEAAEDAVITYPCQSLDDVRTKARFFLENKSSYDTIRHCYTTTEDTLMPFLRSLLGEAPR